MRRYYITRNRIVLARLYFKKEAQTIAKQLIDLCVEILLVIMYEAQKKDKVKAIIKGLRHGILNNLHFLSSKYV